MERYFLCSHLVPHTQIHALKGHADHLSVSGFPHFAISPHFINTRTKAQSNLCCTLISIGGVRYTHAVRSNGRLVRSHCSIPSPAPSLSCARSDGSSCKVWLYMSSRGASRHKALWRRRGPCASPGKWHSLSHCEHTDGSQTQTVYILEQNIACQFNCWFP